MNNFESIPFFTSELLIVFSILVILVLDLVNLKKVIYPFTIFASLLIGIGLFIPCISNLVDITLFTEMLKITDESIYLKLLILVSTTSIILVSKYSKSFDDEYESEYNMLLFSVLLGMFLMVSSINLVMIYLAIELVSIPSYILAGIIKNDRKSNEASLKYVIFGSFASGLMLYGLSMLYGVSGSLNLDVIHDFLITADNPYMIYMSLILMLVGFGYKISMAPMHYWTPDVYEGAPTTITAFFSVAPKIAGFAIIINVFSTLFTIPNFNKEELGLSINLIQNWPMILAVLSAATMTIGNVLALRQDNVKRLLAYSTISHVGFILMPFIFIFEGDAELTTYVNTSIVFYLTLYMFMNLSAFYMVIFAENKLNATTIDDWRGLGYKNLVLGAFMVLSLVSLAGLPPTSGFLGKYFLLYSLFLGGSYYWLGIVAVLNSVISLYYYFRIVKSMYFKDEETKDRIAPHCIIKYSIIIFSAQNVLIYLYWQPLWKFIEGLFS